MTAEARRAVGGGEAIDGMGEMDTSGGEEETEGGTATAGEKMGWGPRESCLC